MNLYLISQGLWTISGLFNFIITADSTADSQGKTLKAALKANPTLQPNLASVCANTTAGRRQWTDEVYSHHFYIQFKLFSAQYNVSLIEWRFMFKPPSGEDGV